MFYHRFPECNNNQCPDSRSLFTPEVKDSFAQVCILHSGGETDQLTINGKRVCKYLNNQRQAILEHPMKSIPHVKKTTTASSLFKSKHSESIIAHCTQIQEDNPGIKLLDAYNKALEIPWKEFQESSLERVEEMKATATTMRMNAVGKIGDQTPEMQKRSVAGIFFNCGDTPLC